MKARYTIFWAALLPATALAIQSGAGEARERQLRAAVELQSQGDYMGAEKALLQLLSEAEKTWPRDPRLATILNSLGIIHQDQGRYVDAEKMYRRAVTIWEHAVGAHLKDLARCVNNLGSLYIDSGQYGKAERFLRTALATQLRTLDAKDPELARLLQNLGAAHYNRGSYKEAEALAVSKGYRDSGAQSWAGASDLASFLSNLGNVCTRTGRLAEAESHLKRVLATLEKIGTPDPASIAPILINLATVNSLAHRPLESQRLHERALTITERAFGPEHPLIADILANYAGALRKRGRKDEAKGLEKRAKAIRALHAPEHPMRHAIDVGELAAPGKPR